MKDPILFRRNDTLLLAEAAYWKDLLYRVTKIGAELEAAPKRGVKRPAFEEALRQALSPSGSFETLGENGVLDVKTEHCGVELRIIGRCPQKRSPKVWQAIKDNLTQNLLFNEERGQEATGLDIVQTNGQMLTQKLAIPAGEFTRRPEYKTLLSAINAQTTLILRHTRRPTKGGTADNRNNHPLQAGPIFGIHNGRINNDDAIFVLCNCLCARQVDSEVIFRLLETLPPLEVTPAYLSAAQAKLQHLQGKFTFLAAALRAPEKLLVVKHQNPLSLHYYLEWKALIFSSRYIFLRKTFGPATLYETLPGSHVFLFEANRLPQRQHRPVSARLLLRPTENVSA